MQGTTSTTGSEPPPLVRGRSRWPVVAVGVLAVVGAVSAVALAGQPGPQGRVLPAELAGLPAQQSGPAEETVDRLTARLSAEPSVADVAVRTYGRDGEVMVVLDLTPRAAFGDRAAAELTLRLLGAVDPDVAATDDLGSAVTVDGLALVTCSAPDPGRATCVSVEADRALVVLTRGSRDDPVERTTLVRDEVRATDVG